MSLLVEQPDGAIALTSHGHAVLGYTLALVLFAGYAMRVWLQHRRTARRIRQLEE